MVYFEFKECIQLLQNRFDVTTQSEVTQIKFPCTGFCYMAIREKDRLIQLVESNMRVAQRKKNNSEIDHSGEFINGPCVKQDFSDICDLTRFIEIGVVEDNLEIEINNISMDLLEVGIGGWIIINRSHETIVAFKLDTDRFWMIDSHLPVHGEVDMMRLCAYIMRNGQCRGTIQIGFCLI
jgi:hypothetical protein